MVSFADDGLAHCRNEQEAPALKSEGQARLAECHPGDASDENQNQSTARTRSAKSTYPNVKFDFLGYCFRFRCEAPLEKTQKNSLDSCPR